MEFSPDSKKLAIAPGYDSVRGEIREISTGKAIPLDLKGLPSFHHYPKFSENGSLLMVTAGNVMRCFEVSTGKILWEIKADGISSDTYTQLQFYRNDSRLLVTWLRDSISALLDTHTGHTLGRWWKPFRNTGYFDVKEEQYFHVNTRDGMYLQLQEVIDGVWKEAGEKRLGHDLPECQNLPFGVKCRLNEIGKLSPKRDRFYNVVAIPELGSQTNSYLMPMVFDLATGNTIAKGDTLSKTIQWDKRDSLALSLDGTKMSVRTEDGLLFYDLLASKSDR